MEDKYSRDTLVMAFTVFRHGDKVPLYFTPNDPNRNHWSEGIGSLTRKGKLQAFELGKVYRQRYDGFLSANYVPSEVYVYSTDTDRCLMSALCCLAAMYPPLTEQDKLHPTLDWQPIPVHTKAMADDPLATDLEAFFKTKDLPDRFTDERHKMLYQDFIINQKGIWDRWREFIMKQGRPGHMFEIGLALETAYIEMKNNLPFELPQDTDISCINVALEAFQLIVETNPHFINQGYELLTIILDRMIGFINGSQKTKMYIYSLHDVNIWSLMSQLDISVQRTEHCGSVTFELHKLSDGQYYVRLRQCARLDSEPVDIPLVDNRTLCPLKSFEDMVATAQLRAESLISNY